MENYTRHTFGIHDSSRFNDYDEYQYLEEEDDALLDSEIAKMSPGVARFIAILFIGYMVLGLTGNFLTILALVRCPRVRNVTAAFIISLCVADFLFCVLVLPWEVSRFLARRWIWGEGMICTLFPLLRYWNVAVSLLSIAMITINRYIMIAHFSVYKVVYRKAFIALMIAFCWVFSFVMLMPTLLNKWGRFGFDQRLQTCSIIDDHNKAPKQVLFGLAFCIPAVVIVICYSLIFMVIHKSEKRMRHHSARSMNGTHAVSGSRSRSKVEGEARRKRNEWRITKMVLIIFIAFLVTYLPITLAKSLDKQVNYPGLHVLGYVLIYLSCCINPIIYVIMNRQYRQAYKTVLLCKRPRLPSLTSSHSGFKKRKDCRRIRDIHCNSCISEGSLKCMENSLASMDPQQQAMHLRLQGPKVLGKTGTREVMYQHRKPHRIRLLGFQTPDTQSLDAISVDTTKALGECQDCSALRDDHKLSCNKCRSSIIFNRSSLMVCNVQKSAKTTKIPEEKRDSVDELECCPQDFIGHLLEVESHSSQDASSAKDRNSTASRNSGRLATSCDETDAQQCNNFSSIYQQAQKHDIESFASRKAQLTIPDRKDDSPSCDDSCLSEQTNISKSETHSESSADVHILERSLNCTGCTHNIKIEDSTKPSLMKRKSLSLSNVASSKEVPPLREKFFSLSNDDNLAFSCTLRHKSPSSRCLLEEVNLDIYERHASWAPWTPTKLHGQEYDNPVFQG